MFKLLEQPEYGIYEGRHTEFPMLYSGKKFPRPLLAPGQRSLQDDVSLVKCLDETRPFDGMINLAIV